MISKNAQIINIMNKNWYVETQTGLEGPFKTEDEAALFLNLLKCNDSARVEFAGLAFSPN